jgi:hypothetical protein
VRVEGGDMWGEPSVMCGEGAYTAEGAFRSETLTPFAAAAATGSVCVCVCVCVYHIYIYVKMCVYM